MVFYKSEDQVCSGISNNFEVVWQYFFFFFYKLIKQAIAFSKCVGKEKKTSITIPIYSLSDFKGTTQTSLICFIHLFLQLVNIGEFRVQLWNTLLVGSRGFWVSTQKKAPSAATSEDCAVSLETSNDYKSLEPENVFMLSLSLCPF